MAQGILKYLELPFCIVGIYGCYITWGILQERVSTKSYPSNKTGELGRFNYFIFLNLIQSIITSIVAFFYLLSKGERISIPRKGLIYSYFLVAFIQSLASQFGYNSLKYINYPTMILGKSCKLVPVVVMNFLLYQKKYPWNKYVTVVLVTVGVSLFTLLQPAKANAAEKTNSIFGIVLLLINLILDGTTNSTQDKIFSKYKITSSQMMLWMNVFSSIIMTGYLLAIHPLGNHELVNAISFVAERPVIIKHIILFGLCGAVGQVFIFYVLGNFGSIVLVTITVTRKMISIVMSVIWFKHKLVLGQWVAVGIVFAGIILDTVVGIQQKRKKQEKSEKEKNNKKA
ncbi:UAA transporter [Anaeromyces robustus]|uniref:UDP-galactose transporter homolog 1 n=1 Tax=Anaeromyces robustus TaxID=1754192 RepID=A0A1Y1XAB0_9FUNG|nr:UAA transporter [Anaeromyces robustus]|eukprot:ORX82683.1 UAA transporter [Anaeromyces robustus]